MLAAVYLEIQTFYNDLDLVNHSLAFSLFLVFLVSLAAKCYTNMNSIINNIIIANYVFLPQDDRQVV